MDIEQQFDLEHLLFKQRTCRCCGRTKDLLNDYYLIRKGRSRLASSYSYECKLCTIERVVKTRKNKKKDRPRPLPPYLADYPDW
mgnify:FL=1